MAAIDTAFLGELEDIFRTEFLKAAPLYVAAGKIKLPFEDAKKTTVLYSGSLSEETRTVETIADYELLKTSSVTGPEMDRMREAADAMRRLAGAAGAVVDGLIRLENVRTVNGADPRQTNNLRVTDIFEHADGRRNLQVISVNMPGSFVTGPGPEPPGWVSYRFYFAAATIRMEYKPQ
jgi:hypothetical protein